MTKIFAGFVLVFLDINFSLSGHTLNLLPDFVGTILLLLGTQELSGESERYPKVRPWLIGITAYTAVVWVLNLLGKTGNFLATLLNIASVVVMLYITYQIVMGFLDIEKFHGIDIQASQTVALWKINAVVQLAAALLGWIPILAIIFIIAMVVVVVMLLIAVNTTRKLYEQQVKPTAMSKGPEL